MSARNRPRNAREPLRETPAEAAAPETPGSPLPPLEWVLVSVVALVAAAAQWWLVHGLRQLPSPILGGDWTYQEACIRSILLSSNPLASPSSGDSLPGYMPLYGNLVAAVVRLTGLGVERAMLGMSIANHFAGTLIVFAVASRHFGRRAGLAAAALWQWGHVGLTVKYTEFTSELLLPLYFDALLLWLRSRRTRHALYLGLAIAVLGYAHAVAFVSGIAIAGASTLLSLRRSPDERGGGGPLASLRGLAIVAACSLLALGYWYRPLFVFHGHTSPHYMEWNGGEAVGTPDDRIAYAGRILARSVAPGDTPARALTALALLGVIALLTDARRRERAVLLVSLLTFAWMFHFLATVPLAHTHFVPDYVRRMMWAFAVLLLAAAGAGALLDRVPAGRVWRLGGIALVVLAAGGIGWQARALARDPSMIDARAPLPAYMLGMQDWALGHTRPGDVVLSTNELSFAWCALTGRKAMVSRRAQNDPYLDLDARNRDAALILYGRDDAKRRELLAHWGVSYLFWTHEWIQTEYVEGPEGLAVNDPLLYFQNPAFDEQLRQDSVFVAPVHTWVDPALRGPEYPQFDLTLISPRNYRSPAHPWTPRLDPFLEPVWEYREAGQRVAALYRVHASGVPSAATPTGTGKP